MNSRPPAQGRIIKRTNNKTVFTYYGFTHLVNWIIKEGFGDWATFDVSYKIEPLDKDDKPS